MKPAGGNPFSFLDGTLNLLVVDRDSRSRDMITRLVEPVSCYTVHTAGSSGEGLELLRSGKRFHGCTLELGMADVEQDEFYLLRQYGFHCSMIVVTGSTSPHKGAECIRLGARAVFEKGAGFSDTVFLHTLERMILINIVNHRYNEWVGDTLNTATRVLFERKPASVTGWADLLRISDRQLRNLWHTSCGFSAKHVLFLFHCFDHAFAYYTAMRSRSVQERAEAEKFFKKRFLSYFENQHEILTFLLS